ncbi:hypothetical protein ACET3Z_025877 [Daucus carota]
MEIDIGGSIFDERKCSLKIPVAIMADSPSPPPPPPKTSLPVLYYGVIVVGIVAVVLAIYNLIIIRWCANHRRRLQDLNQHLDSRRRMSSSSSMRGLNSFNLGESFKYKKGDDDSIQLGYGNNECPVCLCVFEEDEEVRELPRCKHSFHAPCTEMWLYSHSDCPLCRAPVEFPVSLLNSASTPTLEHSMEVLIDPRLLI